MKHGKPILFLFTEDGEKKGEVNELQPFKTYANGNYGDLMKFLSKQTGKPNPNVHMLFFVIYFERNADCNHYKSFI